MDQINIANDLSVQAKLTTSSTSQFQSVSPTSYYGIKPQPNNKYYDKTFGKALDNYQSYDVHQKKLKEVKEEIEKLKRSKKDKDQVHERIIQSKTSTHKIVQNERASEILRQNQLLISRLYDIQTGNPTIRNKSIGIYSNRQSANQSPIGSLNFTQKKKEAGIIDSENIRLMKKIMTIDPVIQKKKFDEQFSSHKKYKNQLKKRQGYEVDRLVDQQRKIFGHVESKTSQYFPSITTNHRRSQSMIQSLNAVDIKNKKLKNVEMHEQQEESVDNLIKKDNFGEQLKTFELKQTIKSSKRTTSNKQQISPNFKKYPFTNNHLYQPSSLENFHDDLNNSQTAKYNNPQHLTLQQQVFTARVKHNILKEKKSFMKSLNETWIFPLNTSKGPSDNQTSVKKKLKKKKNQNDQLKPIKFNNQQSLEIFKQLNDSQKLLEGDPVQEHEHRYQEELQKQVMPQQDAATDEEEEEEENEEKDDEKEDQKEVINVNEKIQQEVEDKEQQQQQQQQ